jgi:hypothetical protein
MCEGGQPTGQEHLRRHHVSYPQLPEESHCSEKSGFLWTLLRRFRLFNLIGAIDVIRRINLALSLRHFFVCLFPAFDFFSELDETMFAALCQNTSFFSSPALWAGSSL